MTEDVLIGSLIDEKYLIKRLVGEGGMGRVYEAHHQVMDRRVALKVLHRVDAGGVKRFERECRALSLVKTCATPELYGWGVTADGFPYLAMEFVDSPSLEELLAQRGTLPVEAVRAIGIGICTGLASVHEAGLVHRDLKPSNIMVKADGGTFEVKLTDLGIARVMQPDGTSTATNSVVGSIAYMSPEHYSPAALDARSDLFSLGCVLYRALAGKAPFEAETAPESMMRLNSNRKELLPDTVPKYLRSIVDMCLAPEPEARFSSAKAVGQALEDRKEVVPIAQATHKKVVAARARQKRSAVSLAVGAAVGLLVVVGVVQQLQQNDVSSDREPSDGVKERMPSGVSPEQQINFEATDIESRNNTNVTEQKLKSRVAELKQYSDKDGAYYMQMALGVFLAKKGKLPEAQQAFAEEVTLAAEAFGDRSEKTVVAKVALAKVFYKQNEIDEAQKLLAEAEKYFVQVGKPNSWTALADTYWYSGEICRLGGRRHDAISYYEKVVPLYRRLRHATGEAECLKRLVELKEAIGAKDEAELWRLVPKMEKAAVAARLSSLVLVAQRSGSLTGAEPPNFAEMIDVVNALDEPGTREQYAPSLAVLASSVANGFAYTKRPTDAKQWLIKAYEFAQLDSDRAGRAVCNINVAHGLMSLDAQRTFAIWKETIEGLHADSKRSVPVLAVKLLVEDYSNIVDTTKAERNDLARRLSVYLKRRLDKTESRADRVIYANAFAELQKPLGSYREGLEVVEQVLGEPVDRDVNPAELARLWHNASNLHHLLKQPDLALTDIHNALEVVRHSSDEAAKVVSARYVGDEYTVRKRLKEATPFYKLSHEYAVKMVRNTPRREIRVKAMHLADYACLGVINNLRSLNDLPGALQLCDAEKKLWSEYQVQSVASAEIFAQEKQMRRILAGSKLGISQ